MPIKPELRKFYGREWRQVVRPRILERAQNRCELCGVPNYETVLRAFSWWTLGGMPAMEFKSGKDNQLIWQCQKSRQLAIFPRESCRWVRIVLTIAHLNHQAGDDRNENLKAMCQWCHLDFDKQHHAESRAVRKDAARPILNALV